jgi:hypothetical protein
MWEYRRDLLLVEIAPVFVGERVEAALRAARGLTAATLALARQLPEPRPAAVVRAEVKRAMKGRDSLGELLPARWAEFEPGEAFEAATAAGDRRAALEEIAPDLPPQLLSRALVTILAVPDEKREVQTTGGREPGRAVARLVGELAAFEGAEALDRIRAMADEAFRGEALAAAATRLPESLISAALDDALAIRSEDARVQAVGAFAARLADERRFEALERCKGGMERLWSAAVQAFAPHLTEPELERALDMTARLRNEPGGVGRSSTSRPSCRSVCLTAPLEW